MLPQQLLPRTVPLTALGEPSIMHGRSNFWTHCPTRPVGKRFPVPYSDWQLLYDIPSPYSFDPTFPSPVEIFCALQDFRQSVRRHRPLTDSIPSRLKFGGYGLNVDLIDKNALTGEGTAFSYLHASYIIATAALAYEQSGLAGPQRWTAGNRATYGSIVRVSKSLQEVARPNNTAWGVSPS